MAAEKLKESDKGVVDMVNDPSDLGALSLGREYPRLMYHETRGPATVSHGIQRAEREGSGAGVVSKIYSSGVPIGEIPLEREERDDPKRR